MEEGSRDALSFLENLSSDLALCCLWNCCLALIPNTSLLPKILSREVQKLNGKLHVQEANKNMLYIIHERLPQTPEWPFGGYLSLIREAFPQ